MVMEPHDRTDWPEQTDELIDEYFVQHDRTDPPNAEGEESSHTAVATANELDPSVRVALDQFRAELATRDLTPPDTELSLQAVWARIRAREAPKRVAASTRRSAWKWPVGIAAGLVIAILGGITTAVLSPRFNPTGQLQEVIEARRFTTARGQQATVRLADGTTVLLGNASELYVSAGFNTQDREVRVVGEAYFTVTNNAAAPFTVRVGNAVTRVLGTEFAVRHFPEDTSVRVIVVSGKVSTGSIPPESHRSFEADAAVLSAGDMADVSTSGSLRISRVENVDAALAWTRGELVFDKATFRDVIPALERFYDVRIRVPDSMLLERRVTTAFYTEPAADAMRFLASVLDVDVVVRDKEITFRLKGGSGR
jgi:transmembrane sensor